MGKDIKISNVCEVPVFCSKYTAEKNRLTLQLFEGCMDEKNNFFCQFKYRQARFWSKHVSILFILRTAMKIVLFTACYNAILILKRYWKKLIPRKFEW